MNPQTENITFQGPAGILEGLLDLPKGDYSNHPPKGTAIIAHPHPLFGGTMHNKIVQTLARAFIQTGWRAVRFNFRGVGASAGEYAEGVGERDDLIAVIEQAARAGEPLALAGFSFGAFATTHAVAHFWPSGRVEKIILVGTAASRFACAELPREAHARTLVVHGQADDTVPLEAVMAWAAPQRLPVTVVPEVEHFFHGQLTVLKTLAMRHIAAPNFD